MPMRKRERRGPREQHRQPGDPEHRQHRGSSQHREAPQHPGAQRRPTGGAGQQRHGRGQREDVERQREVLAQQLAGEVHERRVEGRREARERRRPPGQDDAPREQHDAEHRDGPQQGLDHLDRADLRADHAQECEQERVRGRPPRGRRCPRSCSPARRRRCPPPPRSWSRRRSAAARPAGTRSPASRRQRPPPAPLPGPPGAAPATRRAAPAAAAPARRLLSLTVMLGSFVVANTNVATPPLVPELRLHLAEEPCALWERTEEELGGQRVEPPFWAFAWAGGQALARYVLDHPEVVRGRRVLDVASGSGLVALAAIRAGARRGHGQRRRPPCGRSDRRERRAERPAATRAGRRRAGRGRRGRRGARRRRVLRAHSSPTACCRSCVGPWPPARRCSSATRGARTCPRASRSWRPTTSPSASSWSRPPAARRGSSPSRGAWQLQGFSKHR